MACAHRQIKREAIVPSPPPRPAPKRPPPIARGVCVVIVTLIRRYSSPFNFQENSMRQSTIAHAAMLGAHAQTTATPVGEANDHTSPNAAMQGTPNVKNATNNRNPGVVPPMVGEANDPTSPNATPRPAGKMKTHKMKMKSAKTKPPVTGEANDQTANGGTTEAAKDAKAPGM